MIKRLTLYIICLLWAFAAQARSLMQQADSAYAAEDYRLAIRLYRNALENDGVSPELYYNLGNAYYRIDNIGRAILCYNRALNLDPSYPDARENLNFVLTKVLDRPEDNSSFLGNMHTSISAWMSPNAWAWVALLTFTLLLACVAIYIFSGNVKLRKTGFFGGIVLIFITMYFSVIAYHTARAYTHCNRAVVIVSSTNLMSAPGSQADNSKAVPVREGTVVEITDSVTIPGETSTPKWYNVKIGNANKAWINAADVERI